MNYFINRLNILFIFMICINVAQGQNINDLKQLIPDSKTQSTIQQGNQLNNNQNFEVSRDQNNIISIYKPSESQAIRDSIISQYFGYNFFTSRDSIIFSTSLPPYRDYLLGPGDEIVISMWGETQFRQLYTIDSQGTIFDEKIGKISVSGKTLNEARLYLSNSFGKVYSTIEGRSPTTYIDISLGKVKSINVNFVGHVKYPGIYSLHPFSNIITGLIHSGGVDTTGSLRNIELIRNGEIYTSLDMYEFLINGKKFRNIQLRDYDIISVPLRKSWIEIVNEVNKPGIYESYGNESIYKMIEYASGMTNRASSKVILTRITPLENRIPGASISNNYYLLYGELKNTKARNGDRIDALTMLNETKEVEIIGQVKRPGTYRFFEGMKLSDLIEISGGLSDSTFMKSIYTNSSEIIRRNPETRYEKVIKVNLISYIDNLPEKDIKLSNLDRFVIHANLNFFEKDNVTISGEVNIPGSYPVISDNETLESIINRAGGYTGKAHQEGVSIFRYDKTDKNILAINSQKQLRSRVAWSKNKISVMPGDSIYVKELTNTVSIFGEVYNQGQVEYHEGKSINYYINSSGGLTERGNKNAIVIVYANGTVVPKKWFSNPKVKDGSTIIVHPKEDQEPFDLTMFATNWTSIISSVVTTIILSQQLSGSGQ